VPPTNSDKVVKFPAGIEQRLEAAIHRFDSGENLSEVLSEFLALIDLGCDEAYYFAGCIYEDGAPGVKKDLEKALFYYTKSVDEFGYIEGYLALGRLHYYGIGVEPDYKKAFECYSAVAAKKHHPIAEMMLGRMCQYGRGAIKDLAAARRHYESAARSGNVYAIRGLAALEEEAGHWVKGLSLRLKAGFMAFNIGRKNMRDARLRPG
jgi:hypothetical protein